METTSALERQIRHVVADRLGLAPEELAPAISLSDDLAVDSLDRLELAIALEEEFGVRLPERTIEEIRTYGDLVVVTRKALQARPGPGRAIPVQAQVLPTARARVGGLLRTAPLTPYMVETIGEDVLRGGPLAHLELMVPSDTTDAEAAWVAEQFAFLHQRGVPVSVRRGSQREVPPSQRAGAQRWA